MSNKEIDKIVDAKKEEIDMAVRLSRLEDSIKRLLQASSKNTRNISKLNENVMDIKKNLEHSGVLDTTSKVGKLETRLILLEKEIQNISKLRTIIGGLILTGLVTAILRLILIS